MNLLFFEPPIPQQTGGLQAALESLRTALLRAGLTVRVVDEVPRDIPTETVVHFHGLWQPSHSRIAKRLRAERIPYVVSPHGMLEPWAWRHKRWKKLPYFWLVERRFLAGASCLLATGSPEAVNLRRRLPRTRIETIALGLTGDARPAYAESRAVLGWSADEWVVTFLSRIHEKKGIEMLLDALVVLKDVLPQKLRLVIVGGGEAGYVRKLKARCAAQSVDLPPVDWIGEVWGEEKWRYLQGADLFVLPTHSENFGLAVLEACQVGTPVLTTSATPWKTLLGDGRGYIAEPNPESVTRTLEHAFRDGNATAGRRDALADWAHATFHWDALAQRYADLYRALVSKRP